LVRSDNAGDNIWTIERMRIGRATCVIGRDKLGPIARLFGRVDWVECWPKGGPTGRAIRAALGNLIDDAEAVEHSELDDHPNLLTAYRLLAGHAEAR
jgi:hypothetical protein